MAFNRDKRQDAAGPEDNLDEHTVFINRCAKTVKLGRHSSSDRRGTVLCRQRQL